MDGPIDDIENGRMEVVFGFRDVKRKNGSNENGYSVEVRCDAVGS